MNYKQTKLNLTIPTDYTHDGFLQESQNQVEMAVIYLSHILDLIKRGARNLEGFEGDDEISAFLDGIQTLTSIGFGVLDVINVSTLGMTAGWSKPTIAEQIAFLIKSDDVPAEISDALAQAVSDIQADSMNEHEQTPEYIALILEKYEQKDE